MKFKIYALIDPSDNSVFYIGATSMSLEKRLYQHNRCLTRSKHSGSIENRRIAKIKTIITSGNSVIIKRLSTVNRTNVDAAERKYYNLYKSLGYDLIQDKSQFVSSKKYILGDDFVRVSCRIEKEDYDIMMGYAKNQHLNKSQIARILVKEALVARKNKSNGCSR